MRRYVDSRLNRFGIWPLLLIIASCANSSDEQQVRAVIDAAETAVEKRDASDLLELVTEDYADAQGFDKAQLKNFLRGYFLTHPKIEAAIRVGKVEFETANRARVRVEVVLLGTRLGQSGPIESDSPAAELTGDAEALQVELRREQTRWLVARVDRIPNR